MSTLVRSFLETVARAPDRPALRGRDAAGAWDTLTWSALDRRRRELAAALVEAGLAPGERVAVLAESSARWMIADLAILSVQGVTVPIYPSTAPDDCRHILADSGATAAFVDQAGQAEKLMSSGALRLTVRMDDPAGGDGPGAGWSELLSRGGNALERLTSEIEARSAAASADDLLTIIYTSGTTGRPKGVELTHQNLLYEVGALRQIGLIEETDVQLLFLPMAHVFGKLLECAWLGVGHELVVDSDLGRVASNLAEVRPHIVASVPRVFEKLYARVVGAGVQGSGLNGRLFSWAVAVSDRYARCRLDRRPVPLKLRLELATAKRLVFSKLRARLDEQLGDRLRAFVSGGAPLPKRMAYFFETAGVPILEGYGLTETSAATCVNRPGDNRIGTVGPPLPGTEIRIAEDGEVLVRGPGVMRGYHGLEDETREVLTVDGWFHTGDIGVVDHDNVLTITDRKKDLIVTAGGKNVAPQRIESQLVAANPLVGHALVYGDRKKFLSALIALDRDEAERFGAEHGLEDHAAVAGSAELRARIEESIDRLNEDFARFETVRRFVVLDRPFEVGAELTPSLKVKRRFCTERYGPLLDALYREPDVS